MFSGLAAQENPARRWTAIVSFTLQAAVVAAALVYPLLHPDSLPRIVHPLFLPLSGAPNSEQPERSASHSGNTAPILPIVVSNHEITFGRSTAVQNSGPAQAPDINVLIGTNDGSGLLHSIFSEHMHPLPPAPVQRQALRRSVVMEGNLIHKVEPEYPFIAKQLHIEGTVVLKAFISREGTIERLQVERGQALLAKAAVEAVRQWKYRPYFLNDQPIEVETEITVNFVLQQ